MRPGESRATIKEVQAFMDNLDNYVLNRKVLGGIKVKHIAAAALAYSTLHGFGKIDSAETTGQIYAGGAQAITSLGGAFGMLGEKYIGDSQNNDHTVLNAMVNTAAHFMVSQVENGEKLYDKDGKYQGTMVNRYDENGKIIEAVPVYQIKEKIKEQADKTVCSVKKLFMNVKRQNG